MINDLIIWKANFIRLIITSLLTKFRDKISFSVKLAKLGYFIQTYKSVKTPQIKRTNKTQ